MATQSRSRLIRRIAYVLVGLVIVGFIATKVFGSKQGPEYVTVKVENGDVSQTVALTGTTEPKTRYQLQFTKAGRIGDIRVKVGQPVKPGDVLAVLDNADAGYQLAAQKAVLSIAQANLAKANAGQTPATVDLNKLKVDLAQLDLANASVTDQHFQDGSVNSVNSAYLNVQLARTALQQAKDQYDYAVNLQQQTSLMYPLSSSSTGGSSGALASQGSYLTDANTINNAEYALQKAQQNYDLAQEAYDKAASDLKGQSDTLDNTIQKAQVNVKSAQDQLKITTDKPRAVDLAPLEGQVDQAWQAVHLAEYQLDQTMLKSPDDAIVTDVNQHIGETVSMSAPFITLDSKFLYIRALVSEADIAKISNGQTVKITFDAFGTADEFTGTVYDIDPSETVVQGVVYYEVKIQFDSRNEAVKPGMTANLTIETQTKSGVLRVSARAVQYDGNQAYVQVLKRDGSKQTVEKRNITVGLQGDEDIEVVSGLQSGDEVVTFTKTN